MTLRVAKPSLEADARGHIKIERAPTSANYMEEAEHFRSHGYAIIRGLLSQADVEVLQTECGRLMEIAAEADGHNEGLGDDREWAARERGCIFQALPCSSGRHSRDELFRTDPHEFALRRGSWPCEACASQLLLSHKLSAVARQMLSCERVWLYNDQYIAKPAGSRLAAFAWHRDSEWCTNSSEFNYFPYVSVWCALTDMDQGNGTIVIDPSSADNNGNRLQAKVMAVQTGDAVVMSDQVLHRSGPNLSSFTRVAWMPQFSSGPITRCSGDPVSLAVEIESGEAPM